jgi:predicted nucleic acid-binding protein
MKAVVNSTPLIALAVTGYVSLLNALFDEVFIPSSVYEEVVVKGKNRPGVTEIRNANWLIVKAPQQRSSLPAELLGLDPGERDVILLGQEVTADWLLIDEKLARRVADLMGFQVKGTLGVFLIAYRTGLLTRVEAQKAAQTLAQSSVHLSQKLLEWFETQLT